MTTEKNSRFTVITNKDYETPVRPKPNEGYQTNPIGNGYVNPYYEKLMQFTTNQKRKRFTVEDLLR